MTAAKVERKIGAHTLSIETGKLAKQADGAVIVRYADTMVMVTAVSSNPRMGIDFFPLTTDYREKLFAAGKFPGGFFKREGRPSTKEVLTSRLMDRPIRPLFPETYRNEVAVNALVLSADRENDSDILSMVGSSAALTISTIPFQGPLGSVRVGMIGEEFIINPTETELTESKLDLILTGTADSITMIEGDSAELDEQTILNAIAFARPALKDICEMQVELAGICGKEKQPIPEAEDLSETTAAVEGKYGEQIRTANLVKGKLERKTALSELKETIVTELCPDEEDVENRKKITVVFDNILKAAIRKVTMSGERLDGRKADELRQIDCEVGALPRTHGSAVFQRGETQALVAATLGTGDDEQIIDGLEEEYRKQFILHYNFPAFSVGETWPNRGPKRREIGHGVLAERSLKWIMPDHETFPYTVRLVSEILESNGSSSMATVCGGTLAMMDAGIPIRQPVAGISIGLCIEGEKFVTLTDIIGEEDHYCDMDFKVAGTQNGITGIQLDLKVASISDEIIAQTLHQAKEARMQILRSMLETLRQPREALSPYAPKLVRIKINPDKIGKVIGSGGSVIRKLQEDTDTKIEIIDEEGNVVISGSDIDNVNRARDIIKGMTEDAVIGKKYLGKIVSLRDFGAFVEILPGQEGLLHISEASEDYVKDIADIFKMGDEVEVKVVDVDDAGKIRLSVKENPGKRPERSGGRSGGGRGGDSRRRSSGGGGRDRKR